MKKQKDQDKKYTIIRDNISYAKLGERGIQILKIEHGKYMYEWKRRLRLISIMTTIGSLAAHAALT